MGAGIYAVRNTLGQTRYLSLYGDEPQNVATDELLTTEVRLSAANAIDTVAFAVIETSGGVFNNYRVSFMGVTH